MQLIKQEFVPILEETLQDIMKTNQAVAFAELRDLTCTDFCELKGPNKLEYKRIYLSRNERKISTTVKNILKK